MEVDAQSSMAKFDGQPPSDGVESVGGVAGNTAVEPSPAAEAQAPDPKPDVHAEAVKKAHGGWAPVKAEFLRSREDPGSWAAGDPRGPGNGAGSGAGGGGDGEGSGKAKQRGRNKKRPRDELPAQGLRLCPGVNRGEECPYGDKCRFAHDVDAFLAAKPPDLLPLCPVWDVRGSCPAGLNCLFGNSHLDVASKRSKVRGEEEGGVVELPQPVNHMDQELQLQLRKNKFVFRCDRRGAREFLRAMEKVTDKENPDHSANAGTSWPASKDQPDENETEAEASTATAAAAAEAGPAAEGNATQGAGGEGGGKGQDVEKDEEGIKSLLEGVALREFKGMVDFEGKVYVAPLTTVGNLPFRRIMKDYKADITCGEMALAPSLLSGANAEWALMRRHPCEDIFGVQVAGGHADQLTRAAELVEKTCKVDFVDLNLGCPIDLVTNRGAGSALMTRRRKLKAILQGVGSTLSCPITVKMRTGWDDKKPMAHQVVRVVQREAAREWAAGGRVAAVMVHGRSRQQRYTKRADWDYIRTLTDAQDEALPKLPVIGNGDILSWRDHQEQLDKGGGISTCCMLARGALIKPWLPTEVKEKRDWDISASERLDILRKFVAYGLEHWGSDTKGVNNTRRFLLEWLSFLHRYIPVGIMEVLPQRINQKPRPYVGRNDLETLMASPNASDWVKLSEMVLGKVPDGFLFQPKHKANSYAPPAAEAFTGDDSIKLASG